MIYTVQEKGERLDGICLRHYGRLDGVFEAVLEANPGLAYRLRDLEPGATVTLPDVANPAAGEARPPRLFD